MKQHELKCESEYYQQVEKGTKKFELRKNDRDFKVDDLIVLKEVFKGEYTGRELLPKRIIYILTGGNYGIEEGFVILQLEDIPTRDQVGFKYGKSK